MTNIKYSSEWGLFSTFVVGSLPRPQWLREIIDDLKSGLLSDSQADDLFDQAIPSAITMQERAGLDFISDGEWRRESYVKVFSKAVNGFTDDLIAGGLSTTSSLKYPAVVEKIIQEHPIAERETSFLIRNSSAKTIVAIPSPYTIARRMWSAEYSRAAYNTRQDFMRACIPILRDEVRLLEDLGVDAIQLDDPWLSLLVDSNYRKTEGIIDIEEEIALSVEGVNGVAVGANKVPLSVHLCHAHFNRQHGSSGPYDLIKSAFYRMNVERFAIEFATPDAGGIDILKDFPEDKILGLGVIDHTDPNIEKAEDVVKRVEDAMKFVPVERLTLNPDCGFSPSSANPMDIDEAYLKLKSMCDASDILRNKYA